MKYKKRTDQFMEKALDKMFQAVGFECWDREFTKQDEWYSKKTWTADQLNNFKKWFIKEIKADLKLNKIQAEKEWRWFDLMWGWREQR